LAPRLTSVFQPELFHSSENRARKLVNNPDPVRCEAIDSTGAFSLLTGSSPPVFREQGVHINSLSVSRFAVFCSQFIERTERAMKS
jgi:hypothetical protein